MIETKVEANTSRWRSGHGPGGPVEVPRISSHSSRQSEGRGHRSRSAICARIIEARRTMRVTASAARASVTLPMNLSHRPARAARPTSTPGAMLSGWGPLGPAGGPPRDPCASNSVSTTRRILAALRQQLSALAASATSPSRRMRARRSSSSTISSRTANGWRRHRRPDHAGMKGVELLEEVHRRSRRPPDPADGEAGLTPSSTPSTGGLISTSTSPGTSPTCG